jgi:glutathionyl-hydroquinone reductase
VYTLVTSVNIKTKNIRKITILEMRDTEYLAVLRNDITFKDTAWLKTKVVKTVNTGGYLCGYALYFHEYNSELEKLLKELKKVAKKAETDEDDMIMESILEKIIRFKVIVNASCTC